MRLSKLQQAIIKAVAESTTNDLECSELTDSEAVPYHRHEMTPEGLRMSDLISIVAADHYQQDDPRPKHRVAISRACYTLVEEKELCFAYDLAWHHITLFKGPGGRSPFRGNFENKKYNDLQSGFSTPTFSMMLTSEGWDYAREHYGEHLGKCPWVLVNEGVIDHPDDYLTWVLQQA